MQDKIIQVYYLLENYYGETGWWPAESILEIIIGAVLTQNTSWSNVEKCIKNLKSNNMIDLHKLINLDDESLKSLIKPSGFYNLKAKRLKNVLIFFDSFCGGNFEIIRKKSLNDIRDNLLQINGVGKETADSIILYAFDFPIFVVDAYTKRLFKRLGINFSEDYDNLQEMFHKYLESNTYIYKEYHALIVNVCKDFCKKKPNCEFCPLKIICFYYNSQCWSGDRSR